MQKKLQVFISSTYLDLKHEREAAVQAVLDAGHIPAGMELFRAGNLSQLETVKKWIDNSDAYLLILGGRYGSIENDTQKSYTQLEYEYAIASKIPIFSIVLSDSYLYRNAANNGASITFEEKSKEKYQSFKAIVLTKLVKFADDEKDIRLAIHATLSDFLTEYPLVGWIRGNDTNNSKLSPKKAMTLIDTKNQNNSAITLNDVDELRRNKLGIINIFTDRYAKINGKSLFDTIQEEFKVKHQNICLMGTSLTDFLLDRGVAHEMLMIALQDSSNFFNILISDPKCNAIVERTFWECGPEYCINSNAFMDSSTYIETEGANRIACRLKKKYRTFDARNYEQAPTCFLLFTHNYAFVEHYTYSSRGFECSVMQIETKSILYDRYRKHFDNIWSYANPIENYNALEAIDESLFNKFKRRIGT